MDRTCGVFVVSRDGYVLCCHPTNAGEGKVWSIPKGLSESGETPRQTAARELFEEAGIELDPDKLMELPQVVYKTKKKTLVPFMAVLMSPKTDIRLHCNSYVDCEDPFLEVDRFEWMRPDVARMALHESQERCMPLVVKILKHNGIVVNSR